MRFHRPIKSWLSAGLVLVLLFMQWATAAYACPAAVETAQTPTAMADMPGCDGDMASGMDSDQPLLCKAHCQQGNQVVGVAQPGDWTPWPILLCVIDWRSAGQASQPPAPQRVGPPAGIAPPGSPPIYLSLLVLRN
jgi:hypothetical protein